MGDEQTIENGSISDVQTSKNGSIVKQITGSINTIYPRTPVCDPRPDWPAIPSHAPEKDHTIWIDLMGGLIIIATIMWIVWLTT